MIIFSKNNFLYSLLNKVINDEYSMSVYEYCKMIGLSKDELRVIKELDKEFKSLSKNDIFKKLVLDVYWDIEFFNNSRKNVDIYEIKKLEYGYVARYGGMNYVLNSKDIDQIIYMLNHINNAVDIIPLIDNEGVKLGLFYKKDNKFIFVRQLNKKVGE